MQGGMVVLGFVEGDEAPTEKVTRERAEETFGAGLPEPSSYEDSPGGSINVYGLTDVPIEAVGGSLEEKGAACMKEIPASLQRVLAELQTEIYTLLRTLKAENLKEIRNAIEQVVASGDEASIVELLRQLKVSLDRIHRNSQLFNSCTDLPWCAKRVKDKGRRMVNGFADIEQKFAGFGESYLSVPYVAYEGRARCKVPFQWSAIMQTYSAYLACADVCRKCDAATPYGGCAKLPILDPYSYTKKPEEGQLFPVLPDNPEGKVIVPSPQDRSFAGSIMNSSLDRMLSRLPTKAFDKEEEWESTMPIGVDLGGLNMLEIDGTLLDFLGKDFTQLVFDVRWEDAKTDSFRKQDERLQRQIGSTSNSSIETHQLPSMGWLQAWRKVNPWNGGLAQMSCPVTVTQGSKVVRSTCDLRPELSPGDHIKIKQEEFIVRPPMQASTFLLNAPYLGKSDSDIYVYKVSACFKLAGQVSTVKGSSEVTSSVDQRQVLRPGDVVEIGSEQYEIVAMNDAVTFTISRTWNSINLAHADLFKCPVAVDWGEELPGRCSVVQGSRTVRTSADMTSAISPTDIIKIGTGGDSFQLVEPQDATTLTLNRPFLGITMTARCYRMARSEKQRALEQLAQKKMMCQSLYCLAKIEEEERSVAFALPRELTVLNSASYTGYDDKVKEFDELMRRTSLKEGEEKPGFIPPDDDGANSGPDDGSLGRSTQRNAATSRVSFDGTVHDGRPLNNKLTPKDREEANAQIKAGLAPKGISTKQLKKTGPSKTQSDKAILGEKHDDHADPVKKGGDGEEPETTDLFKKWMKENLPGDLQTPEEMNKKEAAHLAAVRPTTKEQDTAAMKAIRV
jgi:hypothetical protein